MKKRRAAAEIALPFNMDAKVYGEVMAKYFRFAQSLHGTVTGTPEQFFGFTCIEVVTVCLRSKARERAAGSA